MDDYVGGDRRAGRRHPGWLMPAGDLARATTVNVTLHIHPGPDHYSETINCLWHGACYSPPTPGNALDWNNDHVANEQIIWRSYGYRSSGSGNIATGVIQVSNGTCSQIRVHLVDAFSFDKGYSYYTHSATWTPGYSVYAPASSGWSYSSSSIGFSLADEVDPCEFAVPPLWTSQHLHQYADASRFSANTPKFTSTTTSYNVDSYYAWQYSQSWQWNY